VARAHFLQPLLRSARAGAATLLVRGRDTPSATTLIAAVDSASRRRGLLGRRGLAEGEAIVIAPSSAVHTFGMQFVIDLIYASRDGRIVKLREAVPPNRVSAAWRAFAVIEMAAGTIARTGLTRRDQLVITNRAPERSA
jgi:uncharacterized membrane protein (UPF0127 family)